MMRYIFPLLLLVPGVAACGDSDPGGVPSIRIEGASMAPTFTNGAYVEVRTYEAPVQPGDIIVFHLPTRPEREVLKRVIAGPGQTVSINPAEGVAVDGARITEPYTQGETRCTFACQFDIPELVGGGPASLTPTASRSFTTRMPSPATALKQAATS